MKVLIIGGVAGGATAAARLRRLDEQAEIIIIERSGYISYANCGLPYYIGGEITEQKALTLQTPESFWKRFRIEARTRQQAVFIDTANKIVTIQKEDGSRYDEPYDKLILSPGAKAIRPKLDGIDLPGIFTLRTVEDTLAIANTLDAAKPKNAVVVGGGFVGLEMTENLIARGINVTLVERLEQVMAPLDYDMAASVHGYLRDKGITLLLGRTVSGFSTGNEGVCVKLDSGETIDAPLVFLAMGVAPETSLARDAGLTLGVKGSIVVNDRMQTSCEDIYAVGDAVQIDNCITHTPTILPLAGPANKQGRIAADNIAGRNSRYHGAQGSSILKLFDMTIAATGLNESAAKQAGTPYDKVITFSPNHATYYPGASNMTIKTLFDPTNGRILGAQIVGFDGVDKRIDVLATAIRAQMAGYDLTELELAYAPPFSSAKDPVNMAGFCIENVLTKTVSQYHWDEVETLPRDSSVTLLDTRMDGEYARGHIEGTVHIPLDTLRERLKELDPAKPVYVNCQSGLRSYIACRILSQNGFTCYNLAGGYRFYELVTKNRAIDLAPAHPCGLPID